MPVMDQGSWSKLVPSSDGKCTSFRKAVSHNLSPSSRSPRLDNPVDGKGRCGEVFLIGRPECAANHKLRQHTTISGAQTLTINISSKLDICNRLGSPSPPTQIAALALERSTEISKFGRPPETNARAIARGKAVLFLVWQAPPAAQLVEGDLQPAEYLPY